MFRMRPKRPILRAQLAVQNGSSFKAMPITAAHNPTRHRSLAGANQLALAAGSVRKPPGEICWWTESYAKCCSYPGHALPYCVTYPDVGDD